jgi:hypothetical protein
MSGTVRCENPRRAVLPLPGLPDAGRNQADADRDSEAPTGAGRKVGSVKRAGGVRAKPRTRLPPANPRRAKPKGATSSQRTKPAFGRQGLSEGSKPENRGSSGRLIASATGTTAS